MKQIKAKPVETSLGEIRASWDDVLSNGKKQNAGSFPMGSYAGSATITVDGKPVTIEIMHTFGCSLSLSVKNGRTFNLSIEKLIEHAIEAGLDGRAMTFEAIEEERED